MGADMKSKAMVLTRFNTPLELKEFEIPTLKEGEILVKVEAAGVCGSDVHMWRGEDKRTPLPIILGHEGVGRVAELKGHRNYVDGRRIAPGDLILWNRGMSCHSCYECVILNEPSLCSHRKVYGINLSCEEEPYLNGCYSQYIILRANTDIFKIEEEIDPSVLVSAACSGATIAHGFDMINEGIGQTVVVQGPGPLGAYAAAFAKSRGAANIIVIGGSLARLKLCKEFGATHILNRKELSIEERRDIIYDITQGRGADLVVEAVGMQGAAEEGLKLVRMGGTYLTAGYAQQVGSDTIDFFTDVVRKNIKIQGVWVSSSRHTYQAMDIVQKNKTAFSNMITHRFKLEEANEALQVMESKEALKAVILP